MKCAGGCWRVGDAHATMDMETSNNGYAGMPCTDGTLQCEDDKASLWILCVCVFYFLKIILLFHKLLEYSWCLVT